MSESFLFGKGPMRDMPVGHPSQTVSCPSWDHCVTIPQETFALGKRLGEQAKPGEVYCLDGDLGVGKTIFTQGFAAGLGIDEPVNSPTFTIVQQYDSGRIPLYHFDVYRIGDISEMDEIGYAFTERASV